MEAINNDYKTAALLHKIYISDGFLSSMKLEVLEKLYATLQENGNLIVEKANNEIIGFISFSNNLNRTYLHFFKKHPLTVIKLFILSSKNFQILRKLIETATIPFKKKLNEQIPKSELLSIVVDSKYQSKGIAYKLLKSLEDKLLLYRIYSYRVIAGSELIAANKFYLKNGFIKIKEIIIHKGAGSNLYIKYLK